MTDRWTEMIVGRLDGQTHGQEDGMNCWMCEWMNGHDMQ